MNRKEHIDWCKGRALAELQRGGRDCYQNALASMLYDMGRHDETRDHVDIALGMKMARRRDETIEWRELRDWITGFH